MAFPGVEQVVENSTVTASTNHTINLPTATAGQLLLIVLSKGTPANTATIDAHSELTELLDENVSLGLYVAYRLMDGTEPSSYTLVTSASIRTASLVYRVSGTADPASVAPQIGTTGTGTSATPDPPSSATPPSTKDYLFITFYGAAGEEADDDTWSDTSPSNYTPSPPRQKACGTAGTNLAGLIAAAERQLNTGSAENPGTFAKDVSAAWRSQTITIHPNLNVSLSAGSNTVTTSAPTVPSVHLTMPQTANTVTISAPVVPAVHLTMPVDRLQSRFYLASPLLDTFNRPNETPITTGGDWQSVAYTLFDTLPNIVDGTLRSTNTDADTTVVWSGTFNANQEAYITVVDHGYWTAVSLRCTNVGTDTFSGYYFLALPGSGYGIFKILDTPGGVGITQLTSWTGSPANGDMLGARAVGNVLSIWKNSGSGWVLVDSVVDNSFSAGQIGVAQGSQPTPSASLDNFYAGNVAAFGDSLITITAPSQSQLVELTLAAGQNTVTVSAPVATGVFDAGSEVLAAGQNTVIISAPAQSQLVELTLAAGQNTVTVSAPDIPAVALTMPIDTNTVVLSSPVADMLVDGGPLSAGLNTITITAPTVTQHLTMPQTANTVTISAPAHTNVFNTNLEAGQAAITISAPEETVVTSVTMVQAVNTVTVTAPEHTGVFNFTDVAPTNTVAVSAPIVTVLVERTLTALVNTVTVSAPTVSLALIHAVQANFVTITAPVADRTVTFDSVVEAGLNVVLLSVPTITVQPQYDGLYIFDAVAQIRRLHAETMEV